MALHLPTGRLKTRLGMSRHRDANPVPTSPLADDLDTGTLGPVISYVMCASYVDIKSFTLSGCLYYQTLQIKYDLIICLTEAVPMMSLKKRFSMTSGVTVLKTDNVSSIFPNLAGLCK